MKKKENLNKSETYPDIAIQPIPVDNPKKAKKIKKEMDKLIDEEMKELGVSFEPKPKFDFSKKISSSRKKLK